MENTGNNDLANPTVDLVIAAFVTSKGSFYAQNLFVAAWGLWAKIEIPNLEIHKYLESIRDNTAEQNRLLQALGRGHAQNQVAKSSIRILAEDEELPRKRVLSTIFGQFDDRKTTDQMLEVLKLSRHHPGVLALKQFFETGDLNGAIAAGTSLSAHLGVYALNPTKWWIMLTEDKRQEMYDAGAELVARFDTANRA